MTSDYYLGSCVEECIQPRESTTSSPSKLSVSVLLGEAHGLRELIAMWYDQRKSTHDVQYSEGSKLLSSGLLVSFRLLGERGKHIEDKW
eukprot:8503668-Ditylum_brightwellii.AAC.1